MAFAGMGIDPMIGDIANGGGDVGDAGTGRRGE